MIVLIDSTANGHGRWLVQDGNTMSVLSGCCKTLIDAEYYDDDTSKTWARCETCGNLLQENERGWIAHLTQIELFEKTNPNSWSPWGEFWFGMHEFSMKVE